MFFDCTLRAAAVIVCCKQRGRIEGMSKTNKEEIYNLIRNHPEGLDDDDISKITGIEPRQQVQQLCTQLASVKRIRRELRTELLHLQQLCTQLASVKRIRRESVVKAGKRRKIHNFPFADDELQTDVAGGTS